MFAPSPVHDEGYSHIAHLPNLPSVDRARYVAPQNAKQGSKGARMRWGGTTMPGSWCLPGGAPDAAVAEEARAPAEGKRKGRRGRGVRKRYRQEKVKARVHEREINTILRACIDRGPACSTVLALAHKS